MCVYVLGMMRYVCIGRHGNHSLPLIILHYLLFILGALINHLAQYYFYVLFIYPS